MKYADIKNILYKSIEIQQIPDKWEVYSVLLQD